MNPRAHAVRLGLSRGMIETRHSLTNTQDLIWVVMINSIFALVLFFQRDSEIEGVQLATLTLPSIIGMGIAQGGYMGTAGLLAAHREDGTLLRAKAMPHGMIGYFTAQLVLTTFLAAVANVLIVLTLGLLIVDGLSAIGPGGLAALVGIMVLGLLATMPWGAVVGSLVKSAASGFGLTFLPLAGIIAISGIFYPITGLPGWLQGLAQVFPVYWLGLGVRSVMLPGSAVAAELGDSWRQLETVGVLSVWAAVGLLIAPAVLRRMARRESGSTMEDRKQRALHRGY
jgi:ABC-2 type transport system permease protein